jgi:hypothetical protein
VSCCSLPPAERKEAFYVGPGQEFDPKHVGLVTEDPGDGTAFRFDTTQPGNSNAGHAYGTELGHQDRFALIEYLKTL